MEQLVQCNHQTHSHWHISLKAASNENFYATLETGAQANVMTDKTINDRLQTYQMRKIPVYMTSYSGDKIPVMLEVSCKYRNKTYTVKPTHKDQIRSQRQSTVRSRWPFSVRVRGFQLETYDFFSPNSVFFGVTFFYNYFSVETNRLIYKCY